MIISIEKYGSGFIRLHRAFPDYPESPIDEKEFQSGVMTTFTPNQPELPGEAASSGVGDWLSFILRTPANVQLKLIVALNTPLRPMRGALKQLKGNSLIFFNGATITSGDCQK